MESICDMPPKMRNEAIRRINYTLSDLDKETEGALTSGNWRDEHKEIVCKYMNRIGLHIYNLNRETSYYNIATDPFISSKMRTPRELEAINSIIKSYEEKWLESDTDEIGEIKDDIIL